MKKSFTLLEVIISITIFMIVLLFLYRTLDQTKYSNKLFASKQEYIKNVNHISNIIIEDVIEIIKNTKENTSQIETSQDKNKNSRVSFKSLNTYHDIDFNYITYMVSSHDKLVRIESKTKFNFEKSEYDFYEIENAYIDILMDEIEYFEYSNNVFIIKQKNNDRIIIKTFQLFKKDNKENKKNPNSKV